MIGFFCVVVGFVVWMFVATGTPKPSRRRAGILVVQRLLGGLSSRRGFGKIYFREKGRKGALENILLVCLRFPMVPTAGEVGPWWSG